MLCIRQGEFPQLDLHLLNSEHPQQMAGQCVGQRLDEFVRTGRNEVSRGCGDYGVIDCARDIILEMIKLLIWPDRDGDSEPLRAGTFAISDADSAKKLELIDVNCVSLGAVHVSSSCMSKKFRNRRGGNALKIT